MCTETVQEQATSLGFFWPWEGREGPVSNGSFELSWLVPLKKLEAFEENEGGGDCNNIFNRRNRQVLAKQKSAIWDIWDISTRTTVGPSWVVIGQLRFSRLFPQLLEVTGGSKLKHGPVV